MTHERTGLVPVLFSLQPEHPYPTLVSPDIAFCQAGRTLATAYRMESKMKPIQHALLLCACMLVPAAHADVFKCVDDSGHTTYTNNKPAQGKSSACTLMTKEQPVNTVPTQRRSSAAGNASPPSFPRVSDDTQKNRDSDRRQILQNELETEQKLLAAAKKELAEQEAVRNGDERNYQKYLDRLQQYKDSVALHERNIEALTKEISRLR